MKNENKPFNAGLAYSEYKQRQMFYIIAAITAFLMSAYFVVGYFAGHLRIMEWDGSQWAQAVPSVGLVAVMTAYQFFLYSKGDTEGGKKATIVAVCVAVAFSLLSEIGQGMERDSIRMETKSQESPTYKAIVAAIGGSAGASYNPYSADLQTAEMKLAQCQARLAQGKEKHCQGAAARVEAVNKMITSGNQSDQSKALALAATAKTMERDEKNYHPLVNFIREVFGAGGTVASFLLSLTLISMFEYAFHYLGGQFAAAREYLLAHGYDVTRKLRQPPRQFDGSISTYADRKNDQTPTLANALPADDEMKERREAEAMAARDLESSSYDFKRWADEKEAKAPLAAFANSAKQTVGEYAAKVEAGLKASPYVIAREYARADYANKQVLADAGRIGGKIGAKLDDALNAANRKNHPQKIQFPVGEGKTADDYDLIPRTDKTPALSGENTIAYLTPRLSVADTVKQIQACVKASGATSPDAIQAAVFDAFAGMTNPAPLGDDVLNRIAGKLAEKAIPTASPSVPFRQQSGATGIHNPVLGTKEEHYNLPLSTVVDPSPRGLLPVVDHGQQTTETTGDHGQQTTASALEKVAELEQKLAIQADEMEARQRELDHDRRRLQANAQAKLDAEREERNRADAAREREIRQREETTALEARQREAELRLRAEEAAATAARELAAVEALAAEKAERGALTDEQIELATAVIRTAITEGHIQDGVGITQTSPMLKAAGLPTNAKSQRALHKLACKTLEVETLLIQNPDKGVGQPLYLVA